MKSSAERNARRLARAAESLHSCSYYAPEIHQMKRFGYSGWWHSYFAYRSAPLGAASAREVVDLFYNFAPIVGFDLNAFESGLVILTLNTAAIVANVV